jgi:pSer/pThr/pTyr-binding forkhead associated (FHA) protein
MKISLMVLSAGKAAGQALAISGAQFIIGRDPQCNLRPASAMISKRHCAVIVKADQVFLRDFDSTNGTFVNDQQVKGEVPLKDGDILRVGPLSFKMVIEGAPAHTPAKQKPTPTPLPTPANADLSDDDAAAALLSIDDADAGNASATTSETAEDEVPGGTTVMDLPAFVPTEEKPQERTAEQKKPEEKKPAPKKPAGDARDAAKAIFDKLRAGKRK